MSDETPPPLRLKLRSEAAPARPPEEPAPSSAQPPAAPSEPAAPAPGSSSDATSGAAGKLRLKPRLNVDAPAAEPTPPAEKPAAAPAGEPPLAPATPAPGPTDTPQSSEPPGPRAEAPPAPTLADVPHPPVVLGVDPAPTENASAAPGEPVPHLRAASEPPAETETPPPAPRAPDPVKAFRRSTVIFFAVGAVVLIGGGVYLFTAFRTTKVQMTGNATGAAGTARLPMNKLQMGEPSTGTATGSPASTLGQAVQRAKDVAEAQKPRGADVPLPPEPEHEPASVPAPAPTPAPEVATNQESALRRVQIEPGVSATTTVLLASEGASLDFQRWAANLRVSGVFQGEPARVLIDGRMVRAGETVNPALGIVFVDVEPQSKLLVFRDRSGAVVKRKY